MDDDLTRMNKLKAQEIRLNKQLRPLYKKKNSLEANIAQLTVKIADLERKLYEVKKQM